jgi:hypothetical protein
MPFIGPKPADTVLDSTLIADGSITSAKIADGAIVNADLNNSAAIATSKITGLAASATTDTTNAANIASGTIADARISATSVQQHATSFDDNKIVNDISTLAIRQASNENKGAYNTNSMYVDVFQDDTGIASHTQSTRNASEYVSTVSSSSSDSSIDIDTVSEFNNYFTMNDTAWVNTNTNSGSANRTFAKTSNYTGTDTNLERHFSDAVIWNNTSTNANNWVIGFDFGENRKISPTKIDFTHRVGYGSLLNPGGIKVWGSNDLSTITDFGSGTYNQANPTSSVGNTSISTSDFFRYVGFSYQYIGSTNYPQTNDGEIVGTLRTTTVSAQATGNFISNVITAPSSTSKMGAIITYQDNAGTNTLNTDIVLQLSADNGSNFTTATMTALPDFATGIKMAKVNDLSVTAGTQLKYKISFANQASGSKEARIRGVSLQY